MLTTKNGKVKTSIQKKYLLLTDAFSYAINYLLFTLIVIWVIISGFATKPLWERIILPVFAFCSFCMFVVFTFLMFDPAKLEALLRSFVENSSSSDSKPSKSKKLFRLVFPLSLWLVLFICSVSGLVESANRIQTDTRNIVMLIGAIWLIVIPLAALVKLSSTEKESVFKVSKLASHLREISKGIWVILLALLRKIRFFKGRRKSARQFLTLLAIIQGTAGIGLISAVTAFLYTNTSVRLHEPYVFVPLLLHSIAIGVEILLLFRLDDWWQGKPEQPTEYWPIDVVLVLAFSAFGSLVWFLVQTLW